MEKIRELNFKWLWVPQVLTIPVIGFAFFFLLTMSGVGLVFSAICIFAILGLIATAQIYKFYFYYQLSLDINAACKGDGVETKSYLFVYALNVATLGIYGKYWIYKIGQRMQANSPRYGFKMVIGGKELLALDLFSFGWISAWELVRNMNRIAKVYNQTGLAEVVGGVQ